MRESTGGENGWDQIATPAFQQYFGDKISIEELKSELTQSWSQVSGG